MQKLACVPRDLPGPLDSNASVGTRPGGADLDGAGPGGAGLGFFLSFENIGLREHLFEQF